MLLSVIRLSASARQYERNHVSGGDQAAQGGRRGAVVVGVPQAQARQDPVQPGGACPADGGPLEAGGQVGQISEGAGCLAMLLHGLTVQGSGDELAALNGGGHGVVSAAQCGASVAIDSVFEFSGSTTGQRGAAGRRV